MALNLWWKNGFHNIKGIYSIEKVVLVSSREILKYGKGPEIYERSK